MWLPPALPLASVPEGPVTMQDCTPFALHVRVVLLPEARREGSAEMIASGASTSTDANAGRDEPPGPEQMTWNVLVPGVLSAPVEWLPEALPAEKPVPVQEVALVELHEMVTG